ncbi:hypothetical protein NX059_000356 [Plenodomus lindquistii]|nr:hypothetical protein NX059_000356 [Plenodomus lindquistii]
MLSIQPPTSAPSAPPQKVTPNLLPLRISHNGPINSTSRFFTPATDASKPGDNTLHAHFRGRHLHGTPVALPQGYTGAALHVTDRQAPQPRALQQEQQDDGESGGEDEEEVEDMAVDISVAEQVGEFDEIVVWGHGGVVDEGRDMYVRGLREWVGFAESMHCEDEVDGDVEEKKA